MLALDMLCSAAPALSAAIQFAIKNFAPWVTPKHIAILAFCYFEYVAYYNKIYAGHALVLGEERGEICHQ